MNFNVQALPKFESELKKLIKKYPSLKKEFLTLIDTLEVVPCHGIGLGQNCFKIRISIASKGKGKSGGGRIITCFQVLESTVYLLTIFDKSEKENLTDKELRELMKLIRKQSK